MSTFPSFSLLSGIYCASESREQSLYRFQTNADPNQSRFNAKAIGPIQFQVMSKNGVRTSEGEVGAQAGTFAAFKGIKECPRCRDGGKREREETTESPFSC